MLLKQNEANLAAGRPYQQVTEMEFPDGPVKGIHDQFDIRRERCT